MNKLIWDIAILDHNINQVVLADVVLPADFFNHGTTEDVLVYLGFDVENCDYMMSLKETHKISVVKNHYNLTKK